MKPRILSKHSTYNGMNNSCSTFGPQAKQILKEVQAKCYKQHCVLSEQGWMFDARSIALISAALIHPVFMCYFYCNYFYCENGKC